MDKEQVITQALLELKNASLAIQSEINDGSWHKLMETYDLLFLGEHANNIYSVELLHCLQKKFDLSIDIDELNKMIPSLCGALGMRCEPMIRLEDSSMSNPPIANFSISLF